MKLTAWVSNINQATKTATGGTKLWDVITMINIFTEPVLRRKLFHPLDLAQIPNAKHLWPQFQKPTYATYDGVQYGLPYVWGYDSILYKREGLEDGVVEGHVRRPLQGTDRPVAHVTYTLPFAFLVVFTRLHRFDRALEEAAMDLGADQLTTFRLVTLSLILPGLVAGAIFCFTLSFDEFIRTFFVIGNENTLPMYLWSMIMTDSTPQTSAVGSVIVAFSLTWILLGHVFLRK